jgi:hypothetical protein
MSIVIGTATFGAAAMTNARYEVAWQPGAPEHSETEIHIPGVSGSYTSEGGFVGQDLAMVLRWIGITRTQAWDDVNTDIASWRGAVVSITGPGGETFTRCKLRTARLNREIPMGNGSGYHVIDYEIRFRAFAPATLPS